MNSDSNWTRKMLDFRNYREKGRPPSPSAGFKIATVIFIILQSGSFVSSESFIQRGPLTEFNQTSIREKVIFTLDRSPYLITKDVIVHRKAQLVIEPGVEIKFMPEAGITVRGVLTADGLPESNIKFGPYEEIQPLQPNRTLRLVDGPSINEGIVQILELGRWRSVCTNSRNWTQADMEVACKQLGFTGGEWYFWFTHLNDTVQMLYEEPGCIGDENNVESCQWNRRRMGSGVCDHHPNLGLRCQPFHHPESRSARGHWRGLKFESAPYRKDLTAENTQFVSSSLSVLRHVEIVGAGRGRFKGRANATSAIESWGVPPVLDHILIDNSAYNAINFTQPDAVVTISHANITNNRGYGVYVNTTRGYVLLEQSSVTKNMADGVKYYYHDQRPETKLIDGVDIHDFCTYSTTYSQTYPFMMVAEQYEDSAVDRSCGKRFYTKHGYILTLHFMHMKAALNTGASIEIRDGPDVNSRLIAIVDVKNYTRPESVVTTGNNMYIIFRSKAKLKTEVFLEIQAGLTKAYDLNVTDTVVDQNSGRGIWVEWMHSGVHVHNSIVSRNNHVAGFNVRYGAGDVNITQSQIINNFVDGVNITYGGGSRNVSWSTISNNLGYGLAIYINETTVNHPVRHETILQYSNFSLNYDIGALVGNFCGPSLVNVSGSYFTQGRYVGLEVLSCWRDSDLEGVAPGNMQLYIGHNHFDRNQRGPAVKLSPLVRAKGRIEHNDFLRNDDGCVYIYNEDDFILEIQPVDLVIFENRFLNNRGSYVVSLGLSHYDYRGSQQMKMEFNWVQNNLIVEPWQGLNPRSRVAAPVVISSSNVKVHKNLIDNPASRYEIGAHLIEPNTELDCRRNWLGSKAEEIVWERIFDRKDRYNLAKINYIPYLLANNINTELALERPEWEPVFADNEKREVGGEVTGVEELTEDGIYVVKRDINVRPGGRLKITPGVTLKFEHSIGMMIAGEIIAEGDLKGGRPILTLQETERENSTLVPVRLVGGKNSREGRLQVQVDDRWGTVCNFGWTIESAALACQQMGWVLNTEDWEIPPSLLPREGSDDPILMSNVRCDRIDTDITKCKLSERDDAFLNSCTHEDDVGLKCYDVSWSGVRLGMTAKRSRLFDVKIERAGLLDYRTYTFKPALQVDLSHHVFEHIEVSNNDYDGMGVLYSDIYFPDKVNYIINSTFRANKRHGISFRQLGMIIEDSVIMDNHHAGIHHDPKLEKLEQREVTEWMSLIDEQKPNTILRVPKSTEGIDIENPLIIPEGESRLLITQAVNNSDVERVYYIRAERDEFVLGLQLINPFHNYTTEELIIYDYRKIKKDPLIQVWNVTRDIASFPTITSSYAITLVFKPGNYALGNMTLLITPINCVNLPGNCNPAAYYINPIHRNLIVPGSFPRLTIQRTKISHNSQGFYTLHYNRYLGDDSQVYLRKANESIEIFDCEISKNQNEAFYVFTPFRELNQFNISEITYMINRTRFSENGRGIYQYSKDLRDSNNLYHWVLRENIFERNDGEGMDIMLPYVWQYNENYTHTVHIDSNIMVHNRHFGLTIRGHFARVYIVNNTIEDNFCDEGILAFRGMEKESYIFANIIKNNDGVYMVELESDSHSEIMGIVEAYFTENIVQDNRHSHEAYPHAYHPASYTIAVKGVQKFNITQNLFGNEGMDYELLAGIYTARISNFINVESNYWGSGDINVIREKIFDFDDWNSYAIAHFLPYYLQGDFRSSLSSDYERPPELDLDHLGGRLTESVRLVPRPGRPYIIRSDLTVMPGAVLTIEPGVEMEFYPSVGILVLGTMHAQGNLEKNIIMRPVELQNVHDYRLGRQLVKNAGNPTKITKDKSSSKSKYDPAKRKQRSPLMDLEDIKGSLSNDENADNCQPSNSSRCDVEEEEDPIPSRFEKRHVLRDQSLRRTKRHLRLSDEEDFDVRLCQADVNGTVCPEGADQGFLEIFNKTTLQWVPICDERFSERNAEVVCRQLGFSVLNVFLSFDQRIEYRADSLTRIIYWPEPFQCTGKESRLPHCDIRMNGQIYGHKYGCNWEGKNFAFIHCGKENLDPGFEYWGGVRFSVKEFEPELFHTRIHDAVTHTQIRRHESILEYVQIIGAGILHGEKSPAVQTVMASPLLSSINITHSAFDGINIVSPAKTMNMMYNKIANNMGVGISAAVLTGEVRDAKMSTFTPLERVPIPYNTFGLVNICDPQKEIVVEERILLYYKYDNIPVDCVKIFTSVYDVKPIGFRLLHFNFVNSTGEPWIPDQILLYDGDLYNKTTKQIVKITMDGKGGEKSLYTTARSNGMSVRFHATGAREHLGFVAEVVTMPISVVASDRDIKHNMSFSVFENNQRGAIYYASAGEINPIVTLQRNQFSRNCISLYGNFSTCQSAIMLDVQNTQDVLFFNNFVSRNLGGLYIRAGSSGTATAMKGILHNNVFEENVKKITLHLEGSTASPYQQITMYQNYITRSDVAHEPVIKFFQVVCNTSYNTIHNNRGKSIMEVTGFDNVRLPIYQSFTHNGFLNNFAYGLHCDFTTLGYCRWGDRATILAGSAGQEYVDNIFYNHNNDYEMATLNRSAWDVWKTPINAKYNYWAYNETVAVAGRIKDLHDEDGLLEVDFTPFQMNNRTLLSGKCQPGWTLLDSTCYMYHGGPMTYAQARDFCQKDNATIPYIKNIYWYHTLTQYLESQQEDWRYYDMVWVNDLDAPEDQCKVFVDGSVERVSCDYLLPTLCEMDEHVNLSIDFLKSEFVYAIIAGVIGILLIALVCCLWATKTRQRKKERFERRNSIRLSKSSLGSRSLGSVASTGFSDINYRRRIQAIAKSNNPSKASFDSLAEKRSLNFNTTGEVDSFENVMTNPMMPSLGSHMSPNNGASQQTFADLHDIHYAANSPNANFSFANATVHAGYNIMDRPNDGPSYNGTLLSQGPPGYVSRSNLNRNQSEAPDSLLDLKRTYMEQQQQQQQKPEQIDSDTPLTTTSEDGSSPTSSERGESTDRQEDLNHDYQTMDRSYYEASTFRPQHPAQTKVGSTGSRSSPFGGRSLPKIPPNETIPSVPGYAKPVAHTSLSNSQARAQLPPPPAPPTTSPPRHWGSRTNMEPSTRLLETSLDDEDYKARLDTAERVRMRSRSTGQILETNFDADDEVNGNANSSSTPLNMSHSRSLGGSGFMKLGPVTEHLETDM